MSILFSSLLEIMMTHKCASPPAQFWTFMCICVQKVQCIALAAWKFVPAGEVLLMPLMAYQRKQAAKLILLEILPRVIIVVLPLEGSQVINLLPACLSTCEGLHPLNPSLWQVCSQPRGPAIALYQHININVSYLHFRVPENWDMQVRLEVTFCFTMLI